MLSRILVAAFLTLLCLPAYCQSPPVKQTTAVPDYVLYDHFMHRVIWFEGQADILRAQGKNDTFFRSWIRVHAALTLSEEASLKSISADSQQKTSAVLSAISTLVSSGVNPATSQEAQTLASQRQSIVVSHVSQLRAAFGPARYAVLDTFVRRTVKFGTNAAIPPGFVPKAPPAGPLK